MFQENLILRIGEDGSLSQAMIWMEGLLLGSLGTLVAIVALAVVGLAMLEGRLPLRAGSRVIIGCFILFGAPLIGATIVDLARTARGASIAPIQTSPPPIQPAPPNTPATDSDPYAGASVPM